MNEFLARSGRLDAVLSEHLRQSRSQTAALIKSGRVSVNGRATNKPSFALKEGDKVKFELPDVSNLNADSNLNCEFEVEILYEDDDILVVNKPSGLTVHAAPSVHEPTLVDWLKARGCELATLNGEIRAGIVHRLDKGTSGAMVVAKNNIASANLSAQLSVKTMGRIYLALIDLPLKENCIISRPIGRNPANRLKKAIVAGGRAAKSAFASLYQDSNLNTSLVCAKLFTGRTHQIRVHLSSINRHILGDNLYGFKSNNSKIARIMLHAYELTLEHPRTGEVLRFVAPPPGEFAEILKIKKEKFDEIIDPSGLRRAFSSCDSWLRYD